MNRSRSITARWTSPIATSSPVSSRTRTWKISRRPSLTGRELFTCTVVPTGAALMCSTLTIVPTVVWPGSSSSAAVPKAARSIQLMSRGVARTGRSPLPSRCAVSASVTV